MADSLIAVGKIVAPHGVRGDVRVIPLTDFPERFQNLDAVLLDSGVALKIQDVKYHKQFILLRFAGYEDRNAVEALRGKIINVRREQLVKLPEDHYYIFDIVGLKVYSVDGELLGTITDVIHTGSNDVYVAEKDGNSPVLIPALKKVIKKIDISAGFMVVEMLEEWDS